MGTWVGPVKRVSYALGTNLSDLKQQNWFLTPTTHPRQASRRALFSGVTRPRADPRHSFGIASMRTKAVRICSEVTHITSALLSLAKPCNTGVWKERQHIRDQPDNNHKVQSPSDACVSPVTAQKGLTFTWTSPLTGSSPSNKQLI